MRISACQPRFLNVSKYLFERCSESRALVIGRDYDAVRSSGAIVNLESLYCRAVVSQRELLFIALFLLGNCQKKGMLNDGIRPLSPSFQHQ
jgi:hypothetical protein